MRAFLPLLLLIPALLLLAPTQPGAQADEKPSAGLWVYDVRVVHVQSDAVKGLEPAPWEGGASTVATSWKEHLAALQARGKAFVMLDQRASGAQGALAELTTQTEVPLMRFDHKSIQGETRRFDRVRTGVDARLKTLAGLEYSIAVNWLHYAPTQDAVPTGKTAWKGTHPPIADGRTLALVHREHIRGRGGEIETAEIHCFITARFTAE
ncbi:MAG: hypothetical protein QNJ98_00395 [Planctomycetota bacterium]|nr:hypothetical protein [Planctomycetota bacterium]